MAKRKQRDKDLPSRWFRHHGAIYYRVPQGDEAIWDGKRKFRLGATVPEAYRTWAERSDASASHCYTVGQLLDRMMLEHTPTTAPATQLDYSKRVQPLQAYFGHMRIDAVRKRDVHRYMDVRGLQSPRGAQLEKGVLSKAFSLAVEWGLAEQNPCLGIRAKKRPKRDRYVTNDEVAAFRSVCSDFLKAYVDLKLMLGLRKRDMLTMRLDQIRDDGIHTKSSKTGKKITYAWTPELRAAVDACKALRRPRVWRNGKTYTPPGSLYLFATREGKCYVDAQGQATGFDSMWQRTMRKALEKTDLAEKFTEHDLRAKVASDADSDHARQLMGHYSAEITERVYRRKGDVVQPLRPTTAHKTQEGK